MTWAVLTAFFISCTTTKKTTTGPEELDGMQHVTLEEMTVTPEDTLVPESTQPPFRPSRDRVWDLLHTALDISFDWKKEAVIGKATLTLTPVFYEQSTVQLDAVQFDVETVSVNGRPTNDYYYDGRVMSIRLARTYRKDEELQVEMVYTAQPRAEEPEPGGAISSDKGLFFIDPQDTIPGLPQQIWTQGETTNNSRWFPTLDQPNERMTQEIMLTVADTMMTLSNGVLVSSIPQPGGLRKDHWKLDLPHAPYLTMVAVGRWDKVSDFWRGRPVDYYVDPGYGPSARDIFAHTPEMLDFFSRILDYDFVWPKYAQVIVKDFVSGAMENTTAVVFGDFIQFHRDDVVEAGTNDYIVSHEMFHHWFGDLVTCESWANLTLNEGFANYAEYLWQEYKYGREAADVSRMSELSGYFDQAAYEVHPLIHYHYDHEGAMFDAHSYNKGGLVLHMLRDEVGDQAFFASLRHYLKEHAFAAAEVDDLRQAFENVTGRDLQWFFDQWYFGEGHPVLDIQDSFDIHEKRLTVTITQEQADQGYHPVFRLPVEIAILHADSTFEYQKVVLDSRQQVFSFDVRHKPLTVVIDPRDILLAVMQHDVPEEEYAVRALSSSLAISHRVSALRLMEGALAPHVMKTLILDTSYTMRGFMINKLTELQDTEHLYEIALRETRTELKFYAFLGLSPLDPIKAKGIAIELLETTDKAPVIYSALSALTSSDLDEALHQVSHVQNHPADAVFAAEANIFALKGGILTLDYFKTPRAAGIKDEFLEDLIAALALYLSGSSAEEQEMGFSLIRSDFYLKTADPQYRRFYLITGLLRQYGREQQEGFQQKLLDTVKYLYHQETNEYLRSVLKDGLGDLLD